jgi:hypothetical protein
VNLKVKLWRNDNGNKMTKFLWFGAVPFQFIRKYKKIHDGLHQGFHGVA